MTIKLLHFADIHIGMENYGKTHPETGLSSRVMDFLHRLDAMVDFARENEVDLTIFAGDAFKTRNPNPTFQREFAFRILDLAELAPVVLLLGNHDVPTNAKRATSIEIYDTLRVPNVHVGMDYEVLPIETKSGLVQVATAPYPVRARLLETVAGGLTIAELDTLLQQEIERRLTTLASQVAQSDAPRVLTGHFTVAGAITGSERQIMIGRDIAVMLSNIADPAWDYVAMGHIHKFQDLTQKHREQDSRLPPVVYSGSMERIDFGEEGDEKGFVWVELERGKTSYRFISQPARPFITLRVDVRKSIDPTTTVLDEIGHYDLTDAVVRLIITADPETDALLKPKLIEEALQQQGANMIAAITRQVERPTRIRLGGNPEGLTPAELLERYLASRSVEADQMQRLMEAAEDIFRTVEEPSTG